MARRDPRIDLRPGPFLEIIASRLDVRSRRGLPVTVAMGIATAFFAGFLAVAEEVVWKSPAALDRAVSQALLGVASPAVTRLMWLLTLLGDTRVVFVETLVAALLLAVWGHPRRAGSIVVLIGSGSAVVEVLKGLFGRVRPDESLALLMTPESASFPSGHAIAGVLLFGALALMLLFSRVPGPWRWTGIVAALVLGFSIGVSRVYLGVHFVSDVVASWLLGSGLVWLWGAAVLMWGRVVPPDVIVIPNTVAARWWRWLLTVLGMAAVLLAVYLEMPLTPLR